MVLLAFLVDTSASMNQRTCLGTSYLDLAKGAVESFLKIRARDTNNVRRDRYMLVTYDEPSKSVKAGWKEDLQTFLGELKNLSGHGLTNIGRALKETFDLLNMQRLQSGIENYGMGRNPFYLEPALVLLITDGYSALDINGIINEITFPTHDLLPGGELTKELYRWDQRLFTVHLKLPGISSSLLNDKNCTLQPEDFPLSNLCEQTGGRLYSIGSHKSLMQSLESVAQKIMIPGVIINFDKFGPDPEELLNEDQNKPIVETTNNVHNKLTNALHIPNGFVNNYIDSNDDKDSMYDKLTNVNGMMNGSGILPSPSIPPLHRGPQNMLPHGIDKTRNKIISNGLIDKSPVKTEGLSSSVNPIPGVPIRGNEEKLADGSVLSNNPMGCTNTDWRNQRRMIFVRNIGKDGKGSICHWPIPESFWPDSNATKLPARDCQPTVKFTCNPVDAMVIDNMPFDKYELEPSPLTQYILERRQPNIAWQTFVSGSMQNSDIGCPFGYLKASTNLNCVNFFVLPYNYPIIMPLLDELFKLHKCKPTASWKQHFLKYIHTVPSYYYHPLRNALKRMGAPHGLIPNLIPDHLDGSLSYSILAYLKKLKHQAKTDADRLIGLHSQKNKTDTTTNSQVIPRVPQLNDGKLRDFKDLLIQKTTNYHKTERHLQSSTSVKEDPFESRYLPKYKHYCSQSFRNAFDIRHNELIERVAMMRVNFFHSSNMSSNNRMLGDEDSRHVVSIAKMGDYQEFLNQHKPLREVDPSQVRVHTFGNPFKLKQDQIIAVDEADVTENMALSQNSRKRNGDILNSLQKGKRKRSDTPPPSRRPIGPLPNTPPPNIPSSIKLNGENDKRTDFLKATPESKGVLKDLAVSVVDDSFKMNNSLDSDRKEIVKKPSSVNKQLRELQLVHRNKRENNELNSSIGDGEDLAEYLDEHPPILSILRTSLEESDDKDADDEELQRINSSTSNNARSFVYETTRSTSSTSKSSCSSSVVNKTPVSSILSPINIDELFINHTNDALARIYSQLHNRKVVRTRLAVWQSIRDRTDFSKIIEMIRSLPVDMEAQMMFTVNLISEAEKFQLDALVKKLKRFISEL